LAIVVWVMAVYEQDPPRNNEFHNIPIRYVNLEEDLVMVGTPEERASVTVRAPASHWPLSPDVLEATVDLEGLGVGVHNADVRLRSLERTAMVIKRTPMRVVVRLEESVSRQVRVQTVVADPDTVPPGYAMAPARAVPASVTLSGPRSLVESVTKVVATIWLRGSKTGVENQVVPAALDSRGEQVNGVEFSPRAVTVILGVTALAEFRDVTVRAVPKGVPAAGYWISNITVEPAAVTLQGPPDTIRAMPAVVSTEPIEVAGVDESFAKRVALELPDEVSVYMADTSGQSVLVHVEVTAIVGGKTVQPVVEVLGLRSGLTATIAPDTVDVILSGSVPELQALQLGDVTVVVNLFGLRAGRHMVTPTVLLPEGSRLKVERVSPDAVEVAISSAAGGSP
jgi:YbbR domain-containing protein